MHKMKRLDLRKHHEEHEQEKTAYGYGRNEQRERECERGEFLVVGRKSPAGTWDEGCRHFLPGSRGSGSLHSLGRLVKWDDVVVPRSVWHARAVLLVMPPEGGTVRLFQAPVH